MHTVNSLLYKKSGANGVTNEFIRMEREALLFQLINYADQNYAKAYGYTGNVTFDYKCRLRNEIFRIAVDKASASNGTRTTFDRDVIIESFFESTYGRKFADYKDEWLSDDGMVGPLLESFNNKMATYNMPGYNSKILFLSPYDPYFAKDGVFDSKHDHMAYANVSMNNDDQPLNNIFFGKDFDVLSRDKVTLSNMSSRTPAHFNTANEGTGYEFISRFITNKQMKADVKAYLQRIKDDASLKQLTDAHKEFMESVCEWAFNSGLKASVEISSNSDTELILKLGKNSHIRLWDSVDESYLQGRIYDEGIVAYLGLQYDRKGDAASLITNEDRMNAIKYYFGTESIPVVERDVQGKLSTKNRAVKEYLKVGNSEVLKGLGMSTMRRGVVYDRINSTKRSVSSRTGENSIMLAYVNSVNSDPKDANAKPNIVNLLIKPDIASRYVSSESLFMKSLPTLRNIDPSYLFEDDFEDKVDDRENVYKDLKDDVFDDHRRYYKHLPYILELNKWLESAKAHHRELVDIDSLVAGYVSQQDDGQYVPDFIDDHDVDELRGMYGKILDDSYESVELDDIVRDVYEGSSFSFDDDYMNRLLNKTASLEDKVKLINDHYTKHAEIFFGTMPDIQKPGEPLVDNSDKGFNSDNVAKYVNTENSYGSQKNYECIKHMLMNLDDEYNMDWIPYDTMMCNRMKDDLIQYDSSDEIASFKLAGIGYARLFDSVGNPRDNVLDVLAEKSGNNVSGLRDKPVTTDMIMHVARTLIESGCKADSISLSVDWQGVIKYSGEQITDKLLKAGDESPKTTSVEGTIGQIFEPDSMGVITPIYAMPRDKVFVPGYEAYYVPNDESHPKPRSDRFRLLGWEGLMKQAITKNIHRACYRDKNEYAFWPHSTDLNTVYHHMYSTDIPKRDYAWWKLAIERGSIDDDVMHAWYKSLYDDENPSVSYDDWAATVTDDMKTTALYTAMLKKDVIATEAGRCRYSNDYRDSATIIAQTMYENPYEEEAQVYDYSWLDLCDDRNLCVLDPDMDGILDPDFTGGAKTQGQVRYLAEGVKVNPITNKPVPVEVSDDQYAPATTLMKHPIFKDKYFNHTDRVIMAANNALTALYCDERVGIAMIDGALVDNDAFVCSKRYAESHPVKGDNGLRPLGVQDKCANNAGNKGVCAFVADPDMSSKALKNALRAEFFNENEAVDIDTSDTSFFADFDEYLNYLDNWLSEHRGDRFSGFEFDFKGESYALDVNGNRPVLDQLVHAIQEQHGVAAYDDVLNMFYDNPSIDIWCAPHSILSRNNGASVLPFFDDHSDLVLDGKVIEGAIGYGPYMVLDKLADEKTHIQSSVETNERKGRSISSQLECLFQGFGAQNLLRAAYGDSKGYDTLREYLICVGLDIDQDMNIQVGYDPHKNEKRKLIKLPENNDLDLIYLKTNQTYSIPKGVSSKIDAHILDELNKSGGFMELPFSLSFNFQKYINGDALRTWNAMLNQTEGIPDFVKLKPTGHVIDVDSKTSVPTYAMPVLSSALRSGSELLDGSQMVHDYTHHYVFIQRMAAAYKASLYEEQALRDVYDIYRRASSNEEIVDGLFNLVKQDGDRIPYVKRLSSLYFNCDLDSMDRDECLKAMHDRDGARKITKDIMLKDNKAGFASVFHQRLQALIDYRRDIQSKAQSRFDRVVGDIIEKRLCSKDGCIRENIMGNRNMANVLASTLVWSPDPSLNLDELGISRETARHFGLLDKDGNLRQPAGSIVTRDPILNTNQARYFKFVIRDNVVGCSVHPFMAETFQGDFDGDAIGDYVIKDKAADREVKNLCSVRSNLLDVIAPKRMITDPNTGKSILGYPFNFTGGLTRASAEVEHDADGNIIFDETGKPVPSEYKKTMDALEYNVNVFEAMVSKAKESGTLDMISFEKKGDHDKVVLHGMDAVNAHRASYMAQINRAVHKGVPMLGKNVMRFDTAEHFVADCQKMVDDGSKGSQSKMAAALANAGVSYELGQDGRADVKTARFIYDKNGQRATPSMVEDESSNNIRCGKVRGKNLEVMRAIAYKAFGTQHGGTLTQKAIALSRQGCDGKSIRSFMGVTWLLTQAILDSKHDAAKAQSNNDNIQFWGFRAFDGYKLTGYLDSNGDVSRMMSEPHEKIRTTVMNNGVPCVKNSKTGEFYEEYVKCTKQEWIDQINCLAKVVGVYDKLNQECLEEAAEFMCSQMPNECYARNADTGFVVIDKGQPVKSVNSGKVVGFEDGRSVNADALDKGGYLGGFSGLFDRAMMAKKEYADSSVNYKAYPKGDRTRSLVGSLSSDIMSYLDKCAKDVTYVDMKDAAYHLPLANSFVPNSVLERQLANAVCEKTGENSYCIKTENSKHETVIKRKNVTVLGRKDCMCKDIDVMTGTSYLGQSQDEYDSVRKNIESAKDYESWYLSLPDEKARHAVYDIWEDVMKDGDKSKQISYDVIKEIYSKKYAVKTGDRDLEQDVNDLTQNIEDKPVENCESEVSKIA